MNGLHSGALLADGTAKCWGYDNSGQLGDGATKSSSVPVSVKGVANVVSMTAGSDHSCVLMVGGTVKCWGDNGFGQLGTARLSSRSSPSWSRVWATRSAISAGGRDSCASDVGWRCRLLGRQLLRAVGERVEEDLGGSGRGERCGFRKWRRGDRDRRGTRCVLVADGTVTCWGENSHGELGNGTLTDSSTPVLVKGVVNAVAIVAGGEHSCALLVNGTVDCWGDNSNGELGNGTNTSSFTPVIVKGVGGSSRLVGVRAISIGDDHPCALLADGTVDCWGDNGNGELGNGTTRSSFTPVIVKGVGGTPRLTGVRAVSAGGDHTCAVMASGAVECWGFNESGQLGDGINVGPQHCQQLGLACSTLPVDVRGVGGAGGLTGAVSISAGDQHTCAVSLPQGSARCWGSNSIGQLGNGSTKSFSAAPVSVRGLGGPGVLNGVTTLSAGGFHSCALSLPADNAACWGYNAHGQLGAGTGNGPQSCFEPPSTRSCRAAGLRRGLPAPAVTAC